MSIATLQEPVLLELDAATWKRQIKRAELWLGNTLLTQEKFHKLAADTRDAVHEPHIREYLSEMVDRAGAHLARARDFHRMIGAEPNGSRSMAGAVLAKGSELLADIVGLAGGARGNWKDIRQLMLSGEDALGAFAIVEQLGYALGIVELAEAAFQIVGEKKTDQLLILEFLLEMAPVSILLHEDV